MTLSRHDGLSVSQSISGSQDHVRVIDSNTCAPTERFRYLPPVWNQLPIIPSILVGVALCQILLAHSTGLTSWKGGGFACLDHRRADPSVLVH